MGPDICAAYHMRPAAALVRCEMGQGHDPPLDAMDTDQLARVVRRGLEAGLDLHRFKRSAGLPRVSHVLGLLRGLLSSTSGEGLATPRLLDVGSGRGAFLWPLLDAFPQLRVTAIDRDSRCLSLIERVRRGGLCRVSPLRMDLGALGLSSAAHDVTTVLEVLEHLLEPELQPAAGELLRVTDRFVVVSVPSHADDNPQHLRLFDGRSLSELFLQAGAWRVRCEHVLNHLMAVVQPRRMTTTQREEVSPNSEDSSR